MTRRVTGAGMWHRGRRRVKPSTASLPCEAWGGRAVGRGGAGGAGGVAEAVEGEGAREAGGEVWEEV